MSLLGKPIEEVIETLYSSIKNKRQIIIDIKNEYPINNDNLNEIKINRLKLVDILDEFEVTISQSLQAIQTLKVEICNLKEKQATEEILNLTNELQSKYTDNNNNKNINSYNNSLNIFDKFEYSKTTENNSMIGDNIYKTSLNRKTNKNYNIPNNNIPNNKSKTKINDENKKEAIALTEAKLNFDYSNLINDPELSEKNPLSYLDKYKINNSNENINNDIDNLQNNNKNILSITETNVNDILNLDNNIQYTNNKKEFKTDVKSENKMTIEKNNIPLNLNLSNNINDLDIEEEQPSKLNITPSNNANNITAPLPFNFSETIKADNMKSINKKDDMIINNVNDNNDSIFDESDFISLVSKKDIMQEKLKKIEEDEKLNNLLDKIISIKSYKYYLLDKYGDGKLQIFLKRFKNGKIDKTKLLEELNILNDLSSKNNIGFNKTNENNFPKNNKFKKISNKKSCGNFSSNTCKNSRRGDGEYSGPINFQKSLRSWNTNINKNNVSNSSNNISNQTNKNISSHSVGSIRARLKQKKF